MHGNGRYQIHILRQNMLIWDRNWPRAEAAYVAVSYTHLRRSSLSSHRWCRKQRANRQVMSHVQDHQQPASRLTAIKSKLHHTVRLAQSQTSDLRMHRLLMFHLHPYQQRAYCAAYCKPSIRPLLSHYHSVP